MAMIQKRRPGLPNGSSLVLYSPEEGLAKLQQDQDHVNCVFDWGVVHHEYAPPDLTINKEYYINVLHQLKDAMGQKQPQLWATSDWHIHHNNVSAHGSRLVQSFLVKHQIIQVTQPPYSSDLTPCNFWLFPKLKSPLKGKRFQTVDEIQENTTEQMMATGRTVWSPKMPPLKGTEASLSCVQCFLYLVSSSINVSVFHITWLDTFYICICFI